MLGGSAVGKVELRGLGQAALFGGSDGGRGLAPQGAPAEAHLYKDPERIVWGGEDEIPFPVAAVPVLGAEVITPGRQKRRGAGFSGATGGGACAPGGHRGG